MGTDCINFPPVLSWTWATGKKQYNDREAHVLKGHKTKKKEEKQVTDS